ncbi:hypothetical protein MKO06_00385 [Gramella sp. GC03-9]|uniref:Adhesin domain-containing protein n=1 Tax=Christiangramia oceanisediminis TaxID=2920386 RepID=A0A9X2KV62_9FLAO|nr:hypothetical protein [Gramella oceanisediminis]MCP9198345.1 hypothetical protein [Gramella oceanisediminis]
MKTTKHNLMILCLLFITAAGFAQSKKLSKTYKTSANVDVKVDSRHTNIVVENWDKNEVKIEAFIDLEGMSKEQTQKFLDAWDLQTSADNGEVRIKSGGGMNMDIDLNMSQLEGALSQLPEILEPLMENLGPMISGMTQQPLPPELTENMSHIKFDYDAYKRDGDKYLKEWEKNFEKKFGKDFEVKMEKWAKEVEKNSEQYEKEYEAKMEVWAKGFEKDMEAWGEEFGKKMEAWGEQFGKQFEAQMENGGNIYILDGRETSKSKKTIKLWVPNDAKLHMNVRHGELKLGSTVKNLKAELSHSRLSANRLMGPNTNVKVAYSPVQIAYWDYGVLRTEFVKSCTIDKAVSIKLESNSSDIVIKELQKTGVLNGSFGKLRIADLGSGFETLNITLENSDLVLDIPETAFNFNFNGMQSSIKYPQSMTLKSTKSYDNQILNGYNKSRNGNGSISIKANFSDVLIN